MGGGDSTCWTLIRGAAGGSETDRAAFVRTYAPVVRAYLGARWRGGPLADDVEDAVQEVFLDCFRENGALDRADPERGAFRAFLHGVTKNVALRSERRHARRRERPGGDGFDPDGQPADDDALSRVFDRAWARAVMAEAAARQRDAARDEEARRRVELLRLRFGEGLPIREIAAMWGEDADRLHRAYGRARREFEAALLEVVAFHHPGATPAAVRRACRDLIALLA